MRENYDDCLKRVLKHEGGYANHPDDPGGETMYGITKAVAKANGYTGPMRKIPMDLVRRIYREKYWDPLRGDELPSGVDYAVFDFGVNSGISRSAKYLQRLVGVPQDGRMGPATIRAAQYANPATLAANICDARLAFVKGLKTWKTFGAGWGRRIKEVRAHSLKLAGNPPSPDAAPTDDPIVHPNVFKRFWKWFTGAGLLGTLTIGGVTVNADLVYALCALIIVGVGAYLALRWVRSRRAA